MTTQTLQTIRTFPWRVIRWTVLDAGIGALCGVSFGMLYGGFETMVNGEASRIIAAAGYSSLCGAVAGAVLGAFGAFLESIDSPVPDPNSHAVFWAKYGNAVLVNSEAGEPLIVQRPTAPANPLTASLPFAEKMVFGEAGVSSNGKRHATNGSTSTRNGSQLADNGSRPAQSVSVANLPRRRPQRVRWITEDELDN
jgi:hypothetical protein